MHKFLKIQLKKLIIKIINFFNNCLLIILLFIYFEKKIEIIIF
jgi:hypothetical protein